MALEVIPFDLHELGQGVHDLWSEAASAEGVGMVYELNTRVPQWVAGDPTRLRQIMINLVSNALKFTSQGEVRLSIRPAADGLYEIAVADTGPGIPQEQQSKLFQSFAQVDVSTTRKFGGTGLGLAICKQLTTLMGGEISAASREGQGSTFTVSVPLPEAQASVAIDDDDAQMNLTNVHVLVADDNAINQAVARAILEAFGATVTAAADGQDALARLCAGNFGIVLMDIHMPVMGGIEAFGHIRSEEARTRAVPVIALTADAMAGADTALIAEGFDDVAPKPIIPGELVAKIMDAIATRAQADTSAPGATRLAG